MPRLEQSPGEQLLPIGPIIQRGVRYLWYLVETVAGGALAAAYDEGLEINGAQSTPTDPVAHEWRRFIVDFEDTTSDNVADNQQMTFDIVNWTGGVPDGSWTTTDYNNVATAFSTHMWQSKLQSLLPAHLSLSGYRAYIQKFNQYSETKPLADSGPPDWVADVTDSPGGGTGNQASQVCSTITEITTIAGHYGRVYTPTLASSSLDAMGRLTPLTVDNLSLWAAAFYDALYDIEMVPVVVTTQVAKTPKRVLSNVMSVAVDDVPDIIRRRRLRDVTYRNERVI